VNYQTPNRKPQWASRGKTGSLPEEN